MKLRHSANSIFAVLLLINAFVLPSFRASAAIADEPVQPLASTGEQVADALNAVATGISVDNAFGIQPLPYREFGSFWKKAYEDLFDVPFQTDAYILDTELNSDTTDLIRNGHTIEGHTFAIEFALIVEAEFDQPEISQDIRDLFAARSANMLGVVASITTNHGQIYFYGTVNQWDDEDGARIREIVPVYQYTLSEYNKFVEANPELLQILGMDGPIEPGPDATTPYEDCVSGAMAQWQSQRDTAATSNAVRLASITGIMIAGSAACLAGAAIPIIGLIGASACIKAVLAAGALAAAASTSALFVDYAIADNDLDANLQLCCQSFTADCDTGPQ
ncbi:MAG: hypothetical protein JJ974_02365 [Phycisphaerales bacterium]|nr:hypothetical protein [Phycisphaerales bacterium]